MLQPFAHARTIVLKIGSSLVADAEGTGLRTAWMESVAEDVAALYAQNKRIILVSSGAVALGRKALGFGTRALKLEEKQAAAAVGQPLLIDAWRHAFAAHKKPVAQLLLTIDDSEHRRRYLNARATLETLLAGNVLPIINENDTVATAELRVGDNDRLGARVAQMAGADLLVLLSDVDGLYTKNPVEHPDAEHINEVKLIDDSIRSMAGGARTVLSNGGMATKVQAAEIATYAGCHTMIAKGTEHHPIRALDEDAKYTLFHATTTPQNARKRWIAGSLAPQGEVTVDAGAEKALLAGNSLLPVGVIQLSGSFERGDAVQVKNTDGKLLATGLSAWSSAEAMGIIGRNTKDIETILGYKGRSELIHRDDLVMA